MNIRIDTKIVVQERDLTKSRKVRKPLNQVVRPKNIILYDINNGKTKDFVSPYVRPANKEPLIMKNFDSKISGEQQLEASQDNNLLMDGWSADKIVEMREELSKSIKPETLAALKNMKLTNKSKKKEKSKEEELLEKITEICKEANEKNTEENINIIKKDDVDEDTSFIPVKPENKYLNMDKVEMDKMEWMKQLDLKAEAAKSLSIRFHINGRAIGPELNTDEEFSNVVEKEFDPYDNSLRHHGEEPTREGYTISELFWLARSSFGQQKHLAVMTLTNMVRMSKKLEHAHQFNETTITQNLVDSGILFLGRWLIDDAGLRQSFLDDAITLLHAVIVDDTSDRWLFSWPDARINIYLPRLMSKSASITERSRKFMPESEQMNLHDDVIMSEDVITCLVFNTHLLTRLSWLVYAGQRASAKIDKMILEILQRVVSHSPEMASHLCQEHELLLSNLTNTYLKVESPCCSQLLRLLRLVAHSSQALAQQITRDKTLITALYPIIEGPATEARDEAVILLGVMVLRGVHLGPIAELTPSIIDLLVDSLNGDSCESYAFFLVTLVTSEAKISPEIHCQILSAINKCKSIIRETLDKEYKYRSVAALIHLCTTLYKYQLTIGNDIEEATVAHWTDLVQPILEAQVITTLCDQVCAHTILGHEHWHKEISLVKLDLTNLLWYGTVIGAQTANTKYVDMKPFFIELHPSVALLSAVCHTVRAVTESGMSLSSLPGMSTFITQMMDSAPSVARYLNKVANCPPDKVTPSISPYSALVQLELETVVSVVQAMTAMARWTETTMTNGMAELVYKTALRVLPCLGPHIQHLAHTVTTEILFCPRLISKINNNGSSYLLNDLPSLAKLYSDVMIGLESDSRVLSSLNITDSIDSTVVPLTWLDAPILDLYDQCKRNPDQDNKDTSIMHCLAYSQFIELAGLLDTSRSAINGIYRLSYLLVSVPWIDTFAEDNNRAIVTGLLQHYLAQLPLIDINFRVNPKLSFYDIYQDLLNKYFFESLGDGALTNMVLFPCAMRFPAKYRRHLWSDYLGQIRLLSLDFDQTMVPIAEYQSPEETNNDMLRYYWRAVRDGQVFEESSPVLYWICVHHLNRFIFNQTIGTITSSSSSSSSDTKDLMATQRGIARFICDEGNVAKNWVKDVTLYQQMTDDCPRFYEQLPRNRLDHLQRLCK